jgi:hypothetical protein
LAGEGPSAFQHGYRTNAEGFGDEDLAMAEINKLSVGKALEKLRESDQRTSKNARRDEKAAQLDEEIARMREQRLRLERHQRSRK